MVEDMNVSYSLPHESDVERYDTNRIKRLPVWISRATSTIYNIHLFFRIGGCTSNRPKTEKRNLIQNDLPQHQ